MNAAPATPRTLPRAAAQIAAMAGITAALFAVYGPGFLGIDAMWSIVWGRDLAHLSALSESGTTTPHVLSNLLGAVLSPAGADADRALVAIEYVGAAALIWAVALTAREIAGLPAALIAGVLMASREQLLYATRGGFLDVLAAALVAWAALLLVRGRGERLRGVAILLALAGLLRPEPWVLLGVVAVASWWRTRRVDPALAALVVAVPVLWALADLVLSGDALFSLHETRRVSDLFRAGQDIPTGLREQLISIPRTIGRAIGPEVVLLALLSVGLLVWPGGRGSRWRGRAFGAALHGGALEQLRLLVAFAAVLAAVVAAQGLTGTLLFSRFSLQVAAPVVAVVGASLALAITTRAGAHALRWAAAAAVVLAIVGAPLLRSARQTTDPEHARYAAARAVLRPGVPCTPVVVPGLNFRAFAAAWTGVRGSEVAVAAQGIPPAGTDVDAVGTEPERLLLDPSFPQRRVADPSAPIVRSAGGWTLRERCAR